MAVFDVDFKAMEFDHDNGEQAKNAFNALGRDQTTPATTSPLLSYDYTFNGQMIPVRILTFHKCITALKDYQHKCLEELRWEDYQIGRKTKAPNTQQPPLTVATAATARPLTSSPLASLLAPPSSSTFNFRLHLSPRTASSSASALSVNPNTMGTFLKFQPVLGADIKDFRNGSGFVAIDTRLMSIVAMLEYERKSPEELRWEDYQCNRKLNRTTPPSLSSLFSPPKAVEKPTTAQNSSGTDAACPICLETIHEVSDARNETTTLQLLLSFLESTDAFVLKLYS